MKALITAGGRGTRLRPITYTNNKHLIPIANKPILEYAIESVRDAGITDIGITYNFGLDELKDYFSEGEKLGVKITYIHQREPIGLADCVRVSQDFIGNEKFVFYLGDNMLASGVKDIVKDFEEDKENDCFLLLAKVPDPQRFGVPVFDKSGKLIKVEEKPEHPQSDWAVTGVYMYTPKIFEAFNKKDGIKPSLRGELEISDAHQYLLDHKYKVKTFNVTGWWKDTGKLNDLLLANRLILEKHHIYQKEGDVVNSTIEGDVAIARGAIIENSFVRGPVVIGENTKILNSYIGPFTSIEKNCIVTNSEIENSIMLDSSSIIDVNMRIDSSLIGKNAKVVRTDQRPLSINLMVGDMADIKLV